MWQWRLLVVLWPLLVVLWSLLACPASWSQSFGHGLRSFFEEAEEEKMAGKDVGEEKPNFLKNSVAGTLAGFVQVLVYVLPRIAA